MTTDGADLGLNPFVQVFYSNKSVALSKVVLKKSAGLNPFVQVFYSNTFFSVTEALESCVLIPLFRSFILI